CDNRPSVPYDLLSINIGSTPSTREAPGATENTIPVKPIDGFLARFEAAHARILAKGAKARVAVIGAGAGGTELALSLERRLRRDASAAGFDPKGLQFAIVTPGDEVLKGFPAAVRSRFTAEMTRRGVEIITGARVAHVDAQTLHLDGGARRDFDEMFWTTEAAPALWLAQTGLALNERGFLAISPSLQSTSHGEVFAAGDIASIDGYALPKSGVYAVRQGPVLAENLRRAVTGKPLKPYKPQRDALYLISTGEPYAIGTRNGVTFEGAWVWRLKDWIDRRFMAKFNALPRV
ncbi:MAG: FAD-dependent oxidoreductase, partial [Chitinophagales bacterium]|nr:FAD-dependent oxidoreductase [Hyphomicrobiales bacterium]